MTGDVRGVDITAEMQVAYLDYAMSVIVARALPDVRDGLKPVHRRILYAMHDMGLTGGRPYKKSARIVGEVLGKYHPHNDASVYDAMVRMAQEFSLRYPLVDGQGNFGSIDGDNAAAMRYTEARLAAISDLMLADIEKDTIDWRDNFDTTLKEPGILPAALPNLLVNGANGIAVGMATNIPPHNLAEVVDAAVHLIDQFGQVDEVGVNDLLQFIKGPDFPTGGILFRYRQGSKGEEEIDALSQAYATGRGRLILQAKAHFEEMSRSRSRIVVTDLPYQTNKTNLLERIALLVRDGKIGGITDLRDESDRAGHAHRYRVDPQRGAEAGVGAPAPADADAADVRDLLAGAGGRRAAHPHPQTHPDSLHRAPPADHPPPFGVRPGKSPRQVAYCRRSAQGAGHSGRGDPDDSPQPAGGDGARQSDAQLRFHPGAGAGDSGYAPAAADRAGAQTAARGA